MMALIAMDNQRAHFSASLHLALGGTMLARAVSLRAMRPAQ
jgi:hypothetical protein